MPPEDLARLEGHMAEMAHYAQAKDYRRWVVPHRQFHRALTAPAGGRVNDMLGQLFDHAERYRRLHIGHGPSAWATAGHREILDACEAGDRERSAGLLASHLARTGFEVSELLELGYTSDRLKSAVKDAGGQVPGKRPRANLRGARADTRSRRARRRPLAYHGIASQLSRPHLPGRFTETDATRLLWRAGFGPRRGEARRLAALGLDGAVASLTRPAGPARLIGSRRTTITAGRWTRSTSGAMTTAGGLTGWSAPTSS